MAKPVGVKLSLTCSTLSYPRGGRIKSGDYRLIRPSDARAKLEEFIRVATGLIDEAEKQEK